MALMRKAEVRTYLRSKSEKQIPRGNDRKKGKGNGLSESGYKVLTLSFCVAERDQRACGG